MGAFSDAWDVFKSVDRATVGAKSKTPEPGARRRVEQARDEAWDEAVSRALVPGDPEDARALKEMDAYQPPPSPSA